MSETVERVRLRRHQPKKAGAAGLNYWKGIQMRKTYWFTIAAVAVTMLVVTGVWATLTSTAGATKAVGASVQTDPLQMMKDAKGLPAAHYDDFSVGFN